MLGALLALTSALLLTLSFPRYDLSWLMTVALTPLLYAAHGEPRWYRRFLLGWLTGAGCLFGITDWIRFVVTFHGGLGLAAGWGVFLLYCLAKGLYFGLFAALLPLAARRWWTIPATAALWVAVDLTAGSVGYVWVTLGNAGANMEIPMRLAPITGVHGISFAFMMMSSALCGIALRRPRVELVWLTVLLLIAALPPLPEFRNGTERAVVVQPNVAEDREWTFESFDDLTRRLVLRSMQEVLRVGAAKTDIILWPEVPAPFYYDRDARFRQHAGNLARATRTPFLLGVVAHTREDAPLNSALLLSPSGDPVTRYDKIHLVPFGEFVPGPFRIVKITDEIGDFVPGRKIVVSPLDGHQFGTFICYESAFPELVRSFVARGANVLFNLSNDGYFGRSASARGQHLLLVRMRAAENRRWILRATNDGITAAVDPAGRVVTALPSFTEMAGSLEFSYLSDQTFYTRFGDVFGWSCFAISVVLVGWPLKSRIMAARPFQRAGR